MSKLNTLDNRNNFNNLQIQKQFPLSVFVFIDSFVVSALQDAGGYAISRQNNLLIELFYIGMPLVRTDGLSRARAPLINIETLSSV